VLGQDFVGVAHQDHRREVDGLHQVTVRRQVIDRRTGGGRIIKTARKFISLKNKAVVTPPLFVCISSRVITEG
jgi:hypothetical protein